MLKLLKHIQQSLMFKIKGISFKGNISDDLLFVKHLQTSAHAALH